MKTHPHQATDWQKVAMFFAGMITEEHPEWKSYVLQVIRDNTDTPLRAVPAERQSA